VENPRGAPWWQFSRPRSATAEYMVFSAPKHGAHSHDESDDTAKHGDQARHNRGLFRVVVHFNGPRRRLNRGSDVTESLNC